MNELDKYVLKDNVDSVENYSRHPELAAGVVLELTTFAGRLGVQAYAYGLIASGYDAEGQSILRFLALAERKRDATKRS